MLDLRLLCQTLWDFVRSMCVLHSRGPCITVFGSARIGEGAPLYQVARELGRSLAAAGFTVMTGGGPGLMEAANRGAKEAGGRSLGCRMHFAFEQTMNHHLDRSATVRHFFVRKVLMCRQAAGFAVLPGGIGTLDELFEIVALIQTQKMRAKPVVLIGTTYWRPLVVMLEGLVAAGTVASHDLALIKVTDDIGEAVATLAARAPRPRLGPTANRRQSQADWRLHPDAGVE
jgi:uncharacterized protein (TIGR00730 family)